ncbi:MAG: hypothetical protein N838_01355 [Thiohalocapsa sp. PB-PSB1]|nr:MAG: hypothetical protein N838_01355 [Thiohalocapsa sp. PB-PSB1]
MRPVFACADAVVGWSACGTLFTERQSNRVFASSPDGGFIKAG